MLEMDLAMLTGAEQVIVTGVEPPYFCCLFGLGAVAEGHLLFEVAVRAGDSAACRHAGVSLLASPTNGRCLCGHCLPPYQSGATGCFGFPTSSTKRTVII